MLQVVPQPTPRGGCLLAFGLLGRIMFPAGGIVARLSATLNRWLLVGRQALQCCIGHAGADQHQARLRSLVRPDHAALLHSIYQPAGARVSDLEPPLQH